MITISDFGDILGTGMEKLFREAFINTVPPCVHADIKRKPWKTSINGAWFSTRAVRGEWWNVAEQLEADKLGYA